MAILSEENIVRRIKDERWLYNLFKLKQLDSWRDVYVNSDDFRKADLVGIDRDGRIYAFEVKKEGHNVGSAFDQVSDYCMGADFVYCILSEESVTEPSKEKLKKTGIGLLLYRTRKGVLTKPRLQMKSKDHNGLFVKNTTNALSERLNQPKCYIFPVYAYWLKNIFRNPQKSKFVNYGYSASKLPSKGSIIVFYSEKHFVGQGTVFESRKATKKDKTRHSYIASLWAESVYKYPIPVLLNDVKDDISVLQGHSGKSLIQVIRNYPIISSSECQMIVQKALEIIEGK